MERNREYAKQVSKAVKTYFVSKYGGSKGVSAAMTAGVKYPYITLFLTNNLKTFLEDRKLALSVIYGAEFMKTCRVDFIAGNVMSNRIAMKPHEWETFLGLCK